MAAVVDPKTGCKYAAEYAKSSRSKCKKCKEGIEEGDLRMAAMVQSPHFDGLMSLWFHPACFFLRYKTCEEAEVKGFEQVRWEDQQVILAGIGQKGGDAKTAGKTAKGAEKEPKASSDETGPQFQVEQAANERSKCVSCKKKIATRELRLAAVKPKSKQWRHVACFASDREKLKFSAAASELDGFGDLSKSDQSKLSKQIQGIKRARSPSTTSRKKAKTEKVPDADVETLKAQNAKFYQFRDALKKDADKEEWIRLLDENGQAERKGNDDLLDGCADLLAFGALKECTECKGGRLKYNSGAGYACTGRISEWTKCQYTTDTPDRVEPKIPSGMFTDKGCTPILKNYTYVPEVRLIRKAKKVLSEAEKKAESLAQLKRDKQWIDDATTQTLKMKGGAYVDPEIMSDPDGHHIHKDKHNSRDRLWSVVLGNVDIVRGLNSYYKLQLIEGDTTNEWYVGTAWGRVGTTIGGTKLDNIGNKERSKHAFEKIFHEKTGNSWSEKPETFVKHPGRFFPLDIDLGTASAPPAELCAAGSKSKLAAPIQEFVQMIFDIKQMKEVMMEFEIDLTKMPLGKLSKKQLEDAYKILSEVQDMIKNKTGTKMTYLDASNRFYTLIPHDFGMKAPPMLDKVDLVRKKIQMVDSLLEIEIAYNLLGNDGASADEDPIDTHYKKLKTDFTVLPRDSDEWAIIQKYVTNTHASTHSGYKLEIQDIFKISRHGEEKRFKKYEHLGNQMLLWHGSRITNFAGILSQGLRIAPPEAPVSGYMFGKGVYFADMVSKSANYCCAGSSNSVGAMLLCQVALGDAYERTSSEFVTNLPAGKHHCKGIGSTAPAISGAETLDGMTVPLGKAEKVKKQTCLLYNEYIVYDVAQIQAKYLLKMKFNYK